MILCLIQTSFANKNDWTNTQTIILWIKVKEENKGIGNLRITESSKYPIDFKLRVANKFVFSAAWYNEYSLYYIFKTV